MTDTLMEKACLAGEEGKESTKKESKHNIWILLLGGTLFYGMMYAGYHSAINLLTPAPWYVRLFETITSIF